MLVREERRSENYCVGGLLLLATRWTIEDPGSSDMSAHFYQTECCHNVWFMVMFLFLVRSLLI